MTRDSTGASSVPRVCLLLQASVTLGTFQLVPSKDGAAVCMIEHYLEKWSLVS